MKVQFTLLWMVILFSGCAVNPQALPIESGMVKSDYRINSTINLTNIAQGEKFHSWTEALVSALSRELEKRGATISEQATKILQVEIIDIYENPFYAYWLFQCEIDVRIKTDNGYSREIEVIDYSGLSNQRSCGFCLTKSVAIILNDPKIQEYVEVTPLH